MKEILQGRERCGKVTRAITGMVGGLALFAVANIGIAQSAEAATPTCYGDYCSGTDPVESHCADDPTQLQTVAREDLTTTEDGIISKVGVLEIRKSLTCGTEWARADKC